MPTVVTDCPRCGAENMTFDVRADVYRGISYDWQTHHEAAVECRRCKRFSLLKLELEDPDRTRDFKGSGSLSKLDGDLEPTFRIAGFVNVSDLGGVSKSPEHLPEDVAAAFQEGAKCMAIGCHNAAASMFRLCLDLTTKPLLPDSNDASLEQPSKRQKFNLNDRIDWLILQQKIAPDLSQLAHGIRQDGNDGAHDGSLTENDAADLLDFAISLLERQFTEPERLRLAEQRRVDRRTA